MKIGIAGIGGVGGYIGAVLAKNSTENEVYFLARGERLKAVEANGISMDSDFHGKFNVRPAGISSNAAELGEMDILFICVKDYSLETACRDIVPMIGRNTIVVPVMNGVCAANKTRQYLLNEGISGATVLEAVIYIVVFALEGGMVRHVGEARRIHIGSSIDEARYREAAECTAKLLNEAGAVCIYEKDIEAAIWKKYILNCAYNITTAYYNAGIGAMFTDADREKKTRELLEEACLVARAKNIAISPKLEDEFMDYFKQLPYESDSSLQRDINAGKRTELDIFLGELLRQAAVLKIKLPVSEFFYEGLKEKTVY